MNPVLIEYHPTRGKHESGERSASVSPSAAGGSASSSELGAWTSSDSSLMIPVSSLAGASGASFEQKQGGGDQFAEFEFGFQICVRSSVPNFGYSSKFPNSGSDPLIFCKFLSRASRVSHF
jgi:hypothetical protein